MSCRYLSFFVMIAASVPSGSLMYSQTVVGSHSPQERPFVRESVLERRDFPFFADVLQSPQEYVVLAEDPTLKELTSERWAQIAKENHDCGDDVVCKSKAAQFTPGQIQEVSTALRRIYAASASFRTVIEKELSPNTPFALSPKETDIEALVGNWEQSAEDMNQIIGTYAEGVPPRYKEIDAISYPADSHSYAGLVRIILDGLPIAENQPIKPANWHETFFFEPTLRFAMRLLQANSRDEAGRFWPLDSGENAAAIRYARTVHWSRYPYTLIVVPGAGSEIAGVPLSPWGKERLRLALDAYRQKLAPLILVTGGFVHPSQTPYCEAIEMKRYLMEVYGLPDAAILVDPYARHTTTNLRNAAREIYAYGLPERRPMLIVSDTAQTDYIQRDLFQKRMRNELGYLPVTLGKRLSSTRLEAKPSRQSLFVDPIDPLDP